jgi:hypothetical protein
VGRHWARVRAGTSVASQAGPSGTIEVLESIVYRQDNEHVLVVWSVTGPEAGTLDVTLYAAPDLDNAVWEADNEQLTGSPVADVTGYPPVVQWYLKFAAPGYLTHQAGPYEA